MQSLFADKTKRFVERQGCMVVEFRLENNLSGNAWCETDIVWMNALHTSPTPSSFIASMEFRTSELAIRKRGRKSVIPII